MKKALATLLMMPMIAFSQTTQKENEKRDYKAYCLNIQSLDNLLAEFNELPFIRGKSVRKVGDQTFEMDLVIFVNPEKNTWTIVEKTPLNDYCVIAAGGLFGGVPEEIRNDLIKKRQRSRS